MLWNDDIYKYCISAVNWFLRFLRDAVQSFYMIDGIIKDNESY